tara:strand:- start:78 stop:629 length:552 start_codon:yes stop_codon:yes gene_type:complete
MTLQTSKTSPMNKKNILTEAEMNQPILFDCFFSLNQIKQMSEGIETILDNSEHLISKEVYTNICRLIGSLDAEYDTIVNPIEDENPKEDVKIEVTNHLVELWIESPEPMDPRGVGYEVFDRLSMLLEDEGSDFWLTPHEYRSNPHTPTNQQLLERERTAAYIAKQQEEREDYLERFRQKITAD